jgi:hypothetical protein
VPQIDTLDFNCCEAQLTGLVRVTLTAALTDFNIAGNARMQARKHCITSMQHITPSPGAFIF